MPPESKPSLHAEAALLLKHLSDSVAHGSPLGSMSVSVYDTAWVSMVSKVRDGIRYWLFPRSFQLVLGTQTQQGGWPQYASDVDGILNTMAALLAIRRHQKEPSVKGCLELPSDLDQRVSNAVAWLEKKLNVWDVGACDHVGFELLIPSLLVLLSQEGISIQFAGLQTLQSLRSSKLSGFHPTMIYDGHPTTLIHSLEAFIGVVDYDRVSYHTNGGSMMASPSSTAAYLIHKSSWDDTAEAYLHTVQDKGQGSGSGGFPSAFPTSIFELSWVLSTLLEVGLSPSTLGHHYVSEVADFLQEALAKGDGTVGFAPGLLADADDTSKSMLTLSLLGRSVDPCGMLTKFDTGTYFQTYLGERNASFSANCNVLNALLHLKAPSTYTAQITRAASFICHSWCTGTMRDKWNLSTHYSMMLAAQTLTQLLLQWDSGSLDSVPLTLIRDRVPIVLTQILVRTLQSQEANGSWAKGACEITAYAISTLVSIVTLPWMESLTMYTLPAIENGKQFLTENHHRWQEPCYTWIEKVTYSSKVLAQAYCLAAMSVSPLSYSWTMKMTELTHIPLRSVMNLARFFSHLPLFSQESINTWKVTASLVESYLFLPQLQRIKSDIFPQMEGAETKYLEYIPFTWAGCNNLGKQMDNTVLQDMMTISMLNYQADEYMEAVLAKYYKHDTQPIKDIITRICLNSEGATHRDSNSTEQALAPPPEENPGQLDSPSLADVEGVLSRFVTYVVGHEKVIQNPRSVQKQLKQELARFLLAHVSQIEDNARFSEQDHGPHLPTCFGTPRGTYFEWVRTTSADHTSCPYSFVFFLCLISKSGQEAFTTAKQKYLAQDACLHLATMCRQYNDYGSVRRDFDEKNLNSVNFPEFRPRDLSVRVGEDEVKSDVLWLAEYERGCLEETLKRLEGEIKGDLMDALRLFVTVTDLYGQIYVARDVSARVK